MNKGVRINCATLSMCHVLESAQDLSNEKALDELDVLDHVGIRTPPIIPFPVSSSENLVSLGHSHTVRCISEIAGQVVAVTETALEIIREVVESALPGAGRRAEHGAELTT